MASISQEQKQEIIKHFRRGDLDTGSSEVQIALLTFRIMELTEHFKAHPKDAHGTRGLIKLVNRRRRLLDYLKRKDSKKYFSVIGELGIRK